MTPLGGEEAGQLPAGVLCRIIKGDRKGRPFRTPRNPEIPTIAEFNPRMGEVPVGQLEVRITGRKHGIFPEQADQVRGMSREELLRFRLDDPISGHGTIDGFSITGGHHRLNEMIRRVEAGELPADHPVRILFHD